MSDTPAPAFDPQPEIVTVTPTFKAYGEFWAVFVIVWIYDWLVALIVLGFIVGHRYRYSYRVTADSIVFQRGLLMTKTDTLSIMKIKEIIVKQGPLQQLINVGTLRIIHTDPALPIMTMKGIPYPADLKALIARNVRRLREVRAERKAQAAATSSSQPQA